jgi:cytidyltransferase-related domain
MDYTHKIKKISEIIEVIGGTDSKIICCCGCFDIFHIGHLEYLTLSKRLGDILIVGVNSDRSYIEVKKKMPIFDVTIRMLLLAALECVDYVFTFEEATFCKSLLSIKPHIFATGIDHKGKHMDEEDICFENGIEFMYIGEKKRTSSSEIISKINLDGAV